MYINICYEFWFCIVLLLLHVLCSTGCSRARPCAWGVLVGPFTVRLTVSGLPVLVICATATKDSVGAPVRTSLLTPWVTIVGA